MAEAGPTFLQNLATGPAGDFVMNILQALQAAAPAPALWNPSTYQGTGAQTIGNVVGSLLTPQGLAPRIMTQGAGMAQDVANRAGYGKDLEAVLAQAPMFRNMGGAGLAAPFRAGNPLSNQSGAIRPLAPGAMDAIQNSMRARGIPTSNFTEDVMRALAPGEGYRASQMVRNAPPAGNAALDTARAAEVQMPQALPRSGKVFTEGSTAPVGGGNYESQLLKTLQSYLDPAELQKAKARMLPALQMGEGVPSAENLVVGTQAGGHGPLYEAIQGMPNVKMTHGYTDPMTNTFFNDALSTMLYDPAMTQKAVGLLGSGTSVNDLVQALGFSPPP